MCLMYKVVANESKHEAYSLPWNWRVDTGDAGALEVAQKL